MAPQAYSMAARIHPARLCPARVEHAHLQARRPAVPDMQLQAMQGSAEADKKQRKELEERAALLRELDEKPEDLGALWEYGPDAPQKLSTKASFGVLAILL
jgi:hypothetical protein